MRPHLVDVKNSEAAKETGALTEQLNLATFHYGNHCVSRMTMEHSFSDLVYLIYLLL